MGAAESLELDLSKTADDFGMKGEMMDQAKQDNPPALIRIKDEDDAAYDSIVVGPAGMSEFDALVVVDDAIREAHEIENFTWGDLVNILVAKNFTIPTVSNSTERW